MAAHKAPAMQLRDIKPPVPIDDMSIYLYWALMILSIIVVAFALFFLIRFLIGLRRTNIRKTYLDALKRDRGRPRDLDCTEMMTFDDRARVSVPFRRPLVGFGGGDTR